MNSWFGKVLLLLLGVVFLLRGGIGIVLALRRFLLPLVLIGGGIYLVKQYFDKQKNLGPDKKQGGRRPLDPSSSSPDVIAICPHCLQERGSCPKCR